MSKQVGRISGHVLKDNLLTNRDKQNFKNTSGDTATLHLANDLRRIGVGLENPARDLEVPTKIRSVGANADRLELPIFTIDDNITANVGDILINAGNAIQLSGLSSSGVKIDDNTFYSNGENENLELIPSGTGTVELASSLNVYGNINATGNINQIGNLIFGDGPETPDNVAFNTTLNSSIILDQNNTYSLGSQEKRFKELYSNLLNGEAVNITELTVAGVQPGLRIGNTLYVASNGDDNNVGDHPLGAFGSIKHALSAADASTDGPTTIIVYPGTYTEELPLTMPENVVIKGTDIRNVSIVPAAGSESKNVFELNERCGIENITIKDFYYDSINDTGYAFKYAPNAIMVGRSPYIRNITVITKGSVTTADDPRGFDQGDAGRGALIDGSELNNSSVNRSFLFHSATFLTPNADCIVMKNGVRIEWLNSFTYFANRGLYALQGPQGGAEIRSIGSANVYGNFGAVADGADTLMYLINHNFAYIGTGKRVTNDQTYVIESNQTQKLNNGNIYFQNTDELGKFKVGDEFFVNLEDGTTSIDSLEVNLDDLTEINLFDEQGNRTFINHERVDTGNIRLQGNTVFNIGADLNLDSVTGQTNFVTNTRINKDLEITGNLTIDGELIRLGDQPGDTVTLNVKLDQDLLPEKDSRYRLGSPSKLWKRAFLSQAQIDDIRIQDNFITTTDSNSNLQLLSNSTGVVSLENITFKDTTISTYTDDLNFDLTGDIFNLNSNDSFVLAKGNSAQRNTTKGNLRFHNVDNLFEGYGDGVITFGGVYSDDRRTKIITSSSDDIQIFVGGYTEDSAAQVGEVTGEGLRIHGLQGDSVQFNENRIFTVDSNADLEIRRNANGQVTLNGQEYFRNNQWTNGDMSGGFIINSNDDGYLKIASTGAAYLTTIGSLVDENFDNLPIGQAMTGALVWDSVPAGGGVEASGTGSGSTGGFDSASEGFAQYFRFTGANTRQLVSKVYDLTNFMGGRIAGKVIAGTATNGGEQPEDPEDLLLQFSTDGATWTDIAEIAGARNFAAFGIWTDFEILLPPEVESATTQFRIMQRTSSGGTDDTYGLLSLQFRYSTENSTNPQIGSMRYNIGSKQTEVYNGTDWIASTGVEEDPVTDEVMNAFITEWTLILG
jgi:hypothetical protein